MSSNSAVPASASPCPTGFRTPRPSRLGAIATLPRAAFRRSHGYALLDPPKRVRQLRYLSQGFVLPWQDRGIDSVAKFRIDGPGSSYVPDTVTRNGSLIIWFAASGRARKVCHVPNLHFDGNPPSLTQT